MLAARHELRQAHTDRKWDRKVDCEGALQKSSFWGGLHGHLLGTDKRGLELWTLMRPADHDLWSLIVWSGGAHWRSSATASQSQHLRFWDSKLRPSFIPLNLLLVRFPGNNPLLAQLERNSICSTSRLQTLPTEGIGATLNSESDAAWCVVIVLAWLGSQLLRALSAYTCKSHPRPTSWECYWSWQQVSKNLMQRNASHA